MPDYEKLRKNLAAHGFDVTYFDTAAEAVDYLDRKLDGKTVGHGGSITLRDMGLIERLQRHTTVRSHWLGDSFADAAASSAVAKQDTENPRASRLCLTLVKSYIAIPPDQKYRP